MKKISTLLVLFFSCIFFHIVAKEIPGNRNSNLIAQLVSANCNPSASSTDLDIGNVRAKIFIDGDMWNDLVSTPKYEIPKGSGKHSLYAGALWIGGKDTAGNLKIAAQTYRQSGSDFWPGPVDTANGQITAGQCQHYDRHWKITRQEVYNFINGGTPSQVIIDWPGNGDPAFGEDHYLAPFYDSNADGTYDYTAGDYPKYEFTSPTPGVTNKLNGDQTIWWVFNDVGNIHSETGGTAIGVEIRAQAYAFCTSDSDLSNTTFYSYEIICRSSTIMDEAYIGHFVDVDLGFFLDDYVGCDVSRNIGYGYNGDSFDEGSFGYDSVLAAVGVDILQGPVITDSPSNDTLPFMSGFLSYNNDFTNLGNPATAQHYYNYLNGKWKDNSPLVYGGTGYQTAGAPLCNFMFPGNSDPTNSGTAGVDPGFNWTEGNPCIGCSPNAPGDRRFLLSSGKFTMYPGSVTYFTKAAVWARREGGIDSSLAALMRTDDKIQNFFDNNFSTISTCALTIGIDEIASIDHSIFPNPASDHFTLRVNENSKKVSIKIFSAEGKLIFQSLDFKENKLLINTSNWAAGVYYYQLIDNQNKKASGKVIVTREK